jgi:hypothetical protein
MTTADDLARGRDAFDRQTWGDAFAPLSAADRHIPLAPDDLERPATAAFLLGTTPTARVSGRGRITTASTTERWNARPGARAGWPSC